MSSVATDTSLPVRSQAIYGIDLPVDSAGLVDLSLVKRYAKQTDRSPSQWARSPRFTQVVRQVMAKTGQPFDDIWRVDGFRKAARTWAHPMIARAYIEELGLGAMAPQVLADRIEDLEERVAALEQVLADMLGDEPT
jgi:translation initiation factor 2 alpha subunit (eIF-2alpha)